LTMFAGVIAVGVVYNDARIALATQARELASLRVLGFERGEVSALLLGQLAFEVVLALAPGIGIGVGLAKLVMTTVDPEVYRFPLEFADKTFVFACGVVIVAALLSALIVRRRIDHLDLVEVLKTRE
jgi:putative ABC transport system permease protein